MFKSQRQNEILEMLTKENFISVNELSSRLFASTPTVRRDLTALENAGLVKRCHGGVMLYDGKETSPLYFRQGKNSSEKARMARLAATLITTGAVIYADASSTALQLAECLPKNEKLTVITNGLLAAKSFADEGVQVYSTGGKLLTESYAFVGHTAEEALSKYNADIMFFSAASLSSDGEISDWSEEECNMRIAMTRSAALKVFMCDSSKFSKRSPFKLMAIDAMDYVVTDEPLPEGIRERFLLVSPESATAYLYKNLKS